jgi:hypothetical protein
MYTLIFQSPRNRWKSETLLMPSTWDKGFIACIGFESHLMWEEAEEGAQQFYLLDLSGQHTPLNPQNCRYVNVLPRDGVKPGGETIHGCQEKDPGELEDVEYPLDDII